MNRQHATVLERIKNYVWQWIRDPFGRRRITQKHSQVLGEMRELKAAVQVTTNRYDKNTMFPIGDMVGSRNLRRKRKHHGNT